MITPNPKEDRFPRAALSAAREEGKLRERKAVVAHLRKNTEVWGSLHGEWSWGISNALEAEARQIEAGEHLEEG